MDLRYNVRVTIDRGLHTNGPAFRFMKGNANPWPLTFEAATALAKQEVTRPEVVDATVVEIPTAVE